MYPSRNSNEEIPGEAIGLVNEGKVPWTAIITKMIELDQVEEYHKGYDSVPVRLSESHREHLRRRKSML
ncbi:MAG: hypothetical protein ACLTBV_07190 [Enterocloster bolteae]